MTSPSTYPTGASVFSSRLTVPFILVALAHKLSALGPRPGLRAGRGSGRSAGRGVGFASFFGDISQFSFARFSLFESHVSISRATCVLISIFEWPRVDVAVTMISVLYFKLESCQVAVICVRCRHFELQVLFEL